MKYLEAILPQIYSTILFWHQDLLQIVITIYIKNVSK